MDSSLDLQTISADQVAEYLRQHRDFFQLREDLLLDMNLPHSESGNTVSLIEKQVALLRERNIDMRSRLNRLLDNARHNDVLFEKTRRIVLGILEARQLSDVHRVVQQSFESDFDLFASNMLLFSNAELRYNKLRIIPPQTAHREIGGLLQNSKGVCGVLRAEELRFLFADKSEQVGSSAVIPLQDGNVFGVLAIASEDPQHFRSGMDTLFFSFIADVLNRVLPPLMPD